MKEFLELVARIKKAIEGQDLVGAKSLVSKLWDSFPNKEKQNANLSRLFAHVYYYLDFDARIGPLTELDELVTYIQQRPEILNSAVQPQTSPPRPQGDFSDEEVDMGGNRYQSRKFLNFLTVVAAAVLGFSLVMMGMPKPPNRSDAVSNNSSLVSLSQDTKQAEPAEKTYNAIKDLSLPKGKFYYCKFWNWKHPKKEFEGRILIVPESPDEPILCGKYNKDSEIDHLWSDEGLARNKNCTTINWRGVYGKYDRVVGYIPRGKVLKKHGQNWPEYVDVKVVDVELESGEKTRVLVRPDLFVELGVGDNLMPKNIVQLPKLLSEAMVKQKGWLVGIPTARGDIYEFVPLNGKEEPFLCVAETYTSFHGDIDEPIIRFNFGYCPKGVVKQKLQSRYNFFITVEANGKLQRYAVDEDYYKLVKVGDTLPIEKKVRPEY